MNYLEKLTKEDMDNIQRLCFENPDEILNYSLRTGARHRLVVTTYDGHQFSITPYSIANDYGCVPILPNYHQNFLTYMVYKFGKEYIEEYTRNKNNVDILELRAQQELKRLEQAKQNAKNDTKELEQAFENFDFTDFFQNKGSSDGIKFNTNR